MGAASPFTWPGLEAAGVRRSAAAHLLRFLCAQTVLAGSAWAEFARSTTTPVARVSSETRIGLGQMLSEMPGIGPIAWHSGGTFGQESMVGWALEKPLAIGKCSLGLDQSLWARVARAQRTGGG